MYFLPVLYRKKQNLIMPGRYCHRCRYITIVSIAGLILSFTTIGRALAQQPARVVTDLKSGWFFIKEDIQGAAGINLDESRWKKVSIPHDWAISGPFNKENDLQTVFVAEDGDQKAKSRSGRTGGLPCAGVGWYRKHLFFNKEDIGEKFSLEFDGAMSHAQVFVNNQFIGEWPYGYTSFSFPITQFIHFGIENIIAVRLENKNGLSRWYPGAGIYRNVRLVKTNPTHIAHWGTFISTPKISQQNALVKIQTSIESVKRNSSGKFNRRKAFGNQYPGNQYPAAEVMVCRTSCSILCYHPS
jgi:beta-galactosidase